MKYLVIRCEDTAPGADRFGLLKGAKTAHLVQLAQAGAAGTLRYKAGKPIDPLSVHRGLLGLDADAPEGRPGRWYAAAANVEIGPDESMWCCDLLTQRDDTVVDLSGGITSKESQILLQMLDEELGADTRRWEIGDGAHHLLSIKQSVLAPDDLPEVPPPSALEGRHWKQAMPKGPGGQTLSAIIEQASKLLEQQAINRVRIDLNENPANLIWLWGGALAEAVTPFAQRTSLTGALISSSFALKGFARSYGLGWEAGPGDLEESACQRLQSRAAQLLTKQSLVYLHLPISARDPVDRLCIMERLDQLVIKPLTEMLSQGEPWRLLLVVDNRMSNAVPWIAIGSNLPRQPAVSLSAESLLESPLVFQDSVELFSWLTQQ